MTTKDQKKIIQLEAENNLLKQLLEAKTNTYIYPDQVEPWPHKHFNQPYTVGDYPLPIQIWCSTDGIVCGA